MSLKTLGKMIRNLRKEKGLSLRKLAEVVDVSFVNIAHIENGRVKTSKKVLKQIAEALDYDRDELFALADTIDEEIEDIIRKIPKVIPDFLRTAKNLSSEEWNDLTEHVKNINKNK
tara:strand:+ start:147 stop:494 length:348 start_codon:yes stop_codon:yes gene_type:complete